MTRTTAVIALSAIERRRASFVALGASGHDFTSDILRMDTAIREIIADFSFNRDWYALPRDRALVRLA